VTSAARSGDASPAVLLVRQRLTPQRARLPLRCAAVRACAASRSGASLTDTLTHAALWRHACPNTGHRAEGWLSASPAAHLRRRRCAPRQQAAARTAAAAAAQPSDTRPQCKGCRRRCERSWRRR
jgi:hypothetical protein